MKNEERIEGEQIYLRPITREDTQYIIDWRNSESVRPYFIYQKPFTREGHLKWLEEMINSGKGYQFIICLKENDHPVGSTYLRDYDPRYRKAEYGVFIGSEEHKGRGIGRESLKLTLKFAFETLKLHKVFARAFSDNMASINSFLQGGFEQEAYLKDEVRVENRYRDIVLLARLNPWEGHLAEKG
ncbi:MAG: GNAT family N-acetyltransferase [Lachnospiraceae bacterium]|nr:GNAT family N-acetyltransferase [Lachnospiraceae bacterium]